MTTPEIANTRLNIQQLQESLAWSRPTPGIPMNQFQAQCREHLYVHRQLLKQRRHLKRLEREDRKRMELHARTIGRCVHDKMLKSMKLDVDQLMHAFRLPPDMV